MRAARLPRRVICGALVEPTGHAGTAPNYKTSGDIEIRKGGAAYGTRISRLKY